MRNVPYCGDPALNFGLLPRRDAAGGVCALFAGRRVSYSFNTRVAIRKAADILGLKPGDEVLAPAYNCGSELDPLRHAGLKIRLYPVTSKTFIDPDQVAKLIGPRTRAIYLTHYFGFTQPETVAIRALCDAHGLYMFEDCALSLLSGSAPADGRMGDVSVFCFYKFFPVLAGGALVINTGRVPAQAEFDRPAPGKIVGKRLLRGGLSKAMGPAGAAGLLRRIKGKTADRQLPDTHSLPKPDMPGHYYFDPALREARISAFTKRALSGFDVATSISSRRANYTRLLDGLAGISGITPLHPELPSGVVPLSMPVRVAEGGRNALVAKLQAEGITATPWWSGYNRHLDFSDSPEANLSDARSLKDTVLSLPLHQFLGPSEIDHIATRLRDLSDRMSRV